MTKRLPSPFPSFDTPDSLRRYLDELVRELEQSLSDLDKTKITGMWTLTSTAVTTVSSASTLYKLAGATSYTTSAGLSNSGNNALLYADRVPSELSIQANIGLFGHPHDDLYVYIRKWDNKAGAYTLIQKSQLITLSAAGTFSFALINGYSSLSRNDRIELWVENITAGRDVTLNLNSTLQVG